jgi:hypothetical protein
MVASRLGFSSAALSFARLLRERSDAVTPPDRRGRRRFR